MMKAWSLFLFITLVITISNMESKAESIYSDYSVRVDDLNQEKDFYSINAYNDFWALTLAEASARLRDLKRNIQNITVESTGLNFSKLPVFYFKIIGTRSEVVIPLHAIDSRQAIIALKTAYRKNIYDAALEIGGLKNVELLSQKYVYNSCSGLF